MCECTTRFQVFVRGAPTEILFSRDWLNNSLILTYSNGLACKPCPSRNLCEERIEVHGLSLRAMGSASFCLGEMARRTNFFSTSSWETVRAQPQEMVSQLRQDVWPAVNPGNAALKGWGACSFLSVISSLLPSGRMVQGTGLTQPAALQVSSNTQVKPANKSTS